MFVHRWRSHQVVLGDKLAVRSNQANGKNSRKTSGSHMMSLARVKSRTEAAAAAAAAVATVEAADVYLH